MTYFCKNEIQPKTPLYAATRPLYISFFGHWAYASGAISPSGLKLKPQSSTATAQVRGKIWNNE